MGFVNYNYNKGLILKCRKPCKLSEFEFELMNLTVAFVTVFLCIKEKNSLYFCSL